MSSLVEDRFVQVEELRRDGAYVLRVELPAVVVSVAGHYLVLSGTSERGSFSRSLRLPDGAVPSALRTTDTDGVLEVVVPLVSGR